MAGQGAARYSREVICRLSIETRCGATRVARFHRPSTMVVAQGRYAEACLAVPQFDPNWPSHQLRPLRSRCPRGVERHRRTKHAPESKWRR